MLKGEEFKLLARDNKQVSPLGRSVRVRPQCNGLLKSLEAASTVTLAVVVSPPPPLVCVGPNIDGALRGLLNHPSACDCDLRARWHCGSGQGTFRGDESSRFDLAAAAKLRRSVCVCKNARSFSMLPFMSPVSSLSGHGTV